MKLILKSCTTSRCSLLLAILACLVFSACQDVIKVTVPGTTPILAVDGWITDRPGGDTINLYKTQNYFDNAPNAVVSGALLTVTTGSVTENLTEVQPGKYLVKAIRAQEGSNITLNINNGGDMYSATAQVARTSPVLDSLRFQYQSKSPLFDTAGYYVYLFGQEVPGIGDHVRIKFYVNGVFQNYRENLDILDDRFTDGKYLDGFRIAQRSPFKHGQNVAVETWSLSAEAYNFYNDIRTQINNQGIFSRTPVNVRSNIMPATGNEKPATGYFGGSLVHRYTGVVY